MNQQIFIKDQLSKNTTKPNRRKNKSQQYRETKLRYTKPIDPEPTRNGTQTQPPMLQTLVETRHGHKTKTTKQGTQTQAQTTHMRACPYVCCLLVCAYGLHFIIYFSTRNKSWTWH
jgi:hypothetical protein